MVIFKRYKKLFMVLGFLIIVFLLGYLLWLFFFQETFTTPDDPSGVIIGSNGLPIVGPGGEFTGEEITGPGQLPNTGNITTGTIPGGPSPDANLPATIASGGLTETNLLVSDPVLRPTLAGDGKIQYYNKNDGYFYKIDENGNQVKLSDKIFYQVKDVTWAPNSNKAILEYPDGSKIMYDFNSAKQVTLPNYWEDFSFADNSEQIVAKSIGLDPDNRWLITSNSDGSNAKGLESIGENADTVYPSWSPGGQIVAMYTRGVDFDRQEIFFVGLEGENFKSTIVEGRGIQTQWSETGNNLLYSAYHSRDEYRPKLWIVGSSVDNIGANRHSLELNTWADKCTFASDSEVYCAVPENLEAGAGLFPELADRTKDSLYKIDLNTGAKSLIAVPTGSFNISQIIVPANQDYLYFTDKSTEMIHQIKLR